MKINYFVFVLFWLNIFSVHAQLTFHQDIFYGGVTMGGFSTDHQSYGSTGENPLQLYIEPGSTIRHAYLFHYQVGPSITSTVTLNGTEFVFTGEDEILNVGHSNSIATPVRYLYKDITDYLNDNLTDVFNIEVECEANNNYGGFSAYLYIEYDNPNLSKVCSNFVINDQFIDDDITLNISLSEINASSIISLACYFDNIGCQQTDTEDIVVENQFIGTLNCVDSINYSVSGGGVKGHFYYQNNEFFGLDDDIANTTVNNSDAICDISLYLTDNDYNLYLYDNSGDMGMVSNYPLFFVNVYTSPCDTFLTSIIEDQTTCLGDSVLLIATGGNSSYLWNNSLTLSDSISESVYAFPDTTTTYIVKIENTPGCFRTEHVKVTVHPTPQFSSITIFPTVCGDSPEGMIQVNTDAINEIEYYIDGVSGNDPIFDNLSEGNYSLSIINEFGCSKDTIVYLPSEVGVVASFDASPLQGNEPLFVTLNNTSSFATNYEWSINEIPFSEEENPTVLLDTNGVYVVTLLAYNNLLSCSDTFSLVIIVNNALLVQIPNIFTPNDDGLNDEFSIKTDDVEYIKLEVFNRWGNKVFETSKTITSTLQITSLWDGKNSTGKKIASGTYYYIIEVARPNGERHNYQGNVMVME